MIMAPIAPMRVGELARATGVSIRTLHYYDEIGLLVPSLRSEGGHRLYGRDDIERLQRILSLRALGFSLEEIAGCIDNDEEFSARRVVEMHIARMSSQIEEQEMLRRRLQAIAQQLEGAEEVSSEDLIKTIEVMQMVEKYHTPEQLRELDARAQALGPEGLRAAESAWTELMASVREEMQAGTDPKDPRVQELARRWMSLVESFTGGNPEIAGNLKRMWSEEESVMGQQAAEVRELGEYIQRALA